MNICRWNGDRAAFDFYGQSSLVLKSAVAAEAGSQVPNAATLPPNPIRRLQALSVSGDGYLAELFSQC